MSNEVTNIVSFTRCTDRISLDELAAEIRCARSAELVDNWAKRCAVQRSISVRRRRVGCA